MISAAEFVTTWTLLFGSFVIVGAGAWALLVLAREALRFSDDLRRWVGIRRRTHRAVRS